jgi:hypothetical protein
MDWHPDAAKAVPGTLGAVSAVLLLRENWKRGLVMVIPSMSLAWYGGAYMASHVGMPESLSGYLLGMGGMAFIAKVMETWERFDLGGLLGKWLAKVLGLPPEAP